MLSNEEKAVLKTAKENYGLTSAEQKILVNLIKKQSKEIELLKEENEKYKNPPFFDEDNYISKEKSEQKEKEAYIDGTNIADELCNKKWKDKIKAKIEIRKEEKENCKDSIEEKYLLREIYVLQSLLEKE